MSAVVNQNLSAASANNKLASNTKSVQKSSEKLASGQSINRAADAAALLAISEKMRGQIRGFAQAVRNANDGISLIQTAEGGLDATHSALQRMRELSVQASSGTLGETERAAIQLEMNQLKSEVDRIASSTEFNGKKLLDGSLGGADGGMSFQIGANGTEDQQVSLNINDMRSQALGITDASIMSRDLANLSINSFDDAIGAVSSQRANLGAFQNRLEATVNSLTTSGENLTAAESRIRDTDMALEMIKFTTNNIRQQASQAILAQANNASRGLLSLLG
ncbi:MAG: flagellin [Oscillospiraceae bacterium]|nr:flagellin [Oscillospiraceae bacterium]